MLRRTGSPLDPVRALLTAADRARDGGNFGKAARAYARALDLAPDMGPIWVQYAHMLKDAGRAEDGVSAYRQATELMPEDPDPWLHLAHLYKALHRFEDAADAFMHTLERDPSQAHAVAELVTLAGRGIVTDEERLFAILPRLRKPVRAPRRNDSLSGLRARMESLLARTRLPQTDEARSLIEGLTRGVQAAEALEVLAAEAAGAATHVVFDVSDLFGYFNDARLPTGIQRVQIEVITALLDEPTPGLDVRICAFSSGRDVWVETPIDVFRTLSDLALISGELNDPNWQDALKDLKLLLTMSPAMAFPRGAYLVNLGTSWWLQNYFLHVRRARSAYGVRYVPFIHDLIPIMTPEHCVLRLTQDFISWASGVFAHADHYFTNSEASKRDFLAVADRLGAVVDPDDVHVIRLDTDARKPGAETPLAESLALYGLTEGRYVLFVSTIESRKNHLAAFAAWIELARTHGADALPTLVCVGNRGWLNDAVFTKAASDPVLRDKVRMISGVSDPDLANLYRGCRFTLYPSLYEGWGLPVTEALCYGKASLLSDSSSLPEAGGDHVVYFPVGDQKALTEALERLMFDDAWLAEVEARARRFRPRPWRALGLEIADQLRAWAAADHGPARAPAPPLAEAGRYYWMRRVTETSIAPGMTATEVFRIGDGWWQPDDWGVWTKAQGGTLAMSLPPDLGAARLYLGLQGPGGAGLNYSVSIAGDVVEQGALEAGGTQWLSLVVRPDQRRDGVLRVGLKGDAVEDFSIVTKGADPRVASVGLIGFMICAEDDATARADMVDAITFGALPELADRYLTKV